MKSEVIYNLLVFMGSINSAVSVNIAKGLVLSSLSYIPQGDSVSQCALFSKGYTVGKVLSRRIVLSFGFDDVFGRGAGRGQSALQADDGVRGGRR